MIRNRELHYKSRAEIKRFQEERLAETLQYLAARSPYYRRMFAEHGIDIARIATLEDLTSLPVTTKQDLQLHNEEFLCVPRAEVID